MQFSLPKVEDNCLESPKSFSAVEQISFRKKSATLKGRQLPLDLQAVLPLDLCALEKQHDSIVFYCPVFYSVLQWFYTKSWKPPLRTVRGQVLMQGSSGPGLCHKHHLA